MVQMRAGRYQEGQERSRHPHPSERALHRGRHVDGFALLQLLFALTASAIKRRRSRAINSPSRSDAPHAESRIDIQTDYPSRAPRMPRTASTTFHAL